MRLPVIEGIIRRRILANFSADPDVVARILPAPLRPKLAGERAVVGICLIRLEQIRMRHVPAALGLSSENAAHRFAVTWTDEEGREREGVYIPRRDTDSMLNHLAGGRLFPGEHHHADFTVHDDGAAVDLSMRARDGGASVTVRGGQVEGFSSSLFASLDVASDFFRAGSLGYSARQDPHSLDGITLHTDAWKVAPMRVDDVGSSFFEDTERFPRGSVTFDCALLMRDIPHEWRSEPDLAVGRPVADP
jgi:uncharacterized protein YqjF (DUF2071 family)